MRRSEIEILFVEDNPEDAELAIRALKKHNLANKLLHVRDGAEALEIIFAPSGQVGALPRLVLLDLKLPKVDGLEVLRRIKSDPRTRSMPVVVMTSSREEQDMVKSYDLGANSYVVKPIDFEQFTRAVAELGLYWLLINDTPRD